MKRRGTEGQQCRMSDHGRIRIGVGGWNYDPWIETFYPNGLPRARQLEYASRTLTSIEIDSTYYGGKTPKIFRTWRDATPEDFVFAVKGSRFVTNRRVLAEAGPSMERFFSTGVTELKQKLGPINWQFAKTKRFDPDDFAAFLALLPQSVDGVTLRHAVEVRHDSFRTREFRRACSGARRRRRHRGRRRIPADRGCHRAVRLRADHGDARGRRRRAIPTGRWKPGPDGRGPGRGAKRPTISPRSIPTRRPTAGTCFFM